MERKINKEKMSKQILAPMCHFPLLVLNGEKITAYSTSPFHKKPFEYAVDIECEKGSEIYSPVSGQIIDLKQNSTRWLPYKKDSSLDPNEILNWITIQIYEKVGILKRSLKKTPWIVQLCHIEAFSLSKTKNEFVEKGERIARVGLNGMISTTKGKPDIHVHIVIGKGLSPDDPFTNFQSYPIRFENNPITNLYK